MLLNNVVRRSLMRVLVGGVVVARQSFWNTPCAQSRRKDNEVGATEYDVAVIGGGVVGLAVARALAASKRGLKIVVVEKEDSIAAGASSGNSGLGCTGYDAPHGSLESLLLRRSIRLHPELYRSFGLSMEGGHVRKCGSLVVAWTQDEVQRLPQILDENRQAGDTDARLLSREELREMAPALSQEALGAVFCPYEAVVEPWLVPVGFAVASRRLGVDISCGRKVTGLVYENCDDEKTARKSKWRVITSPTHQAEICSSGRSARGSLLVEKPDCRSHNADNGNTSDIFASVVINCAGLYGDEIERMRISALNDSKNIQVGDCSTELPPFSVTPRKGQFVVFRPKTYENLDRDTMKELKWQVPEMIIEPVPTTRTKGVILWQTVYGTVVVGPTATDQDSKYDRSTDEITLQKLISHGRRVVPALEHWEVIGSYSGLRPSTEHRDYQIRAEKSQQWICVGGIRSTGLTAATGIGEYVKNMYEEDVCAKSSKNLCEHVDCNIMGVSQSAAQALPLPSPMPQQSKFLSLADLSSAYMSSNIGGEGDEQRYLEIDGFRYRVTHPISSFGMENYSYISSISNERNLEE